MSATWLKGLFPEEDMAFCKDSIGGIYKGYGLSVKKMLNSAVIKMSGDTSSITEKKFEEWLDGIEKDFGKLQKREKSDSYILLEIKDSFTKGQFMENVRGLTEELRNLMEKNKIKTCCESCGNKKIPAFYYVAGEPRLYCNGCGEQKKQEMEDMREKKKKEPSRIPLGILGALIGSLPGGALWAGIIVYGLYNGLAGVASVVIVTGAVLGCRLLGKKLGKAAVITVSVISAIVMFLANHLIYTWLIYTSYAYAYEQTYSMLLRTVISWIDNNYFFESSIEGVSLYWIGLMVGAALGLFTGGVCYVINRISFKNKYGFKMVSAGK